MRGVTDGALREENASGANESDAQERCEKEQKLARSGRDIVRDYELYKYRLLREKYEGHGDNK